MKILLVLLPHTGLKSKSLHQMRLGSHTSHLVTVVNTPIIFSHAYKFTSWDGGIHIDKECMA